MRMKIGKIISLVLASSIIIGLGAAYDSAEAAKKATLKTKPMRLTVGESKKIVIKNKNKKAKYTFTSSSKKVAKVNKKGKVTAVKKGQAKITVKEVIKKGGKKQTRKVGGLKVRVLANNDKISTQAPPQNQIQTQAPLQTPAAQTPAPDVPIVTQGPTMEPAYGVYSFDSFKFDGTYSINMDNLIKYGAACEVSVKLRQDSGSDKEVSVGYLGNKYGKGNKAEPFEGGTDKFMLPSGQEMEHTFKLNVDKYMGECEIVFESESGTDIEVLSAKISTQPFDGADYGKMLNDSFISAGNSERMQKVINKSRSGADVTLAYLGGSITEGCAATDVLVNSDCYAETSYNAFKMKYGYGDGSNVHFINAGMSGTPSSLGVIRYQNDILNEMEYMGYGKYPDILFVEFVVNDSGECTNGEAMESIIRQALEQGTAVFLVFAHTVNFDTGKQDYYIPLGELYDLPMVSVKNSISDYIDSADTKGCDVSKWFFWHDTLHPDVPGHRLMADMIMNAIDKAAESETVPDSVTDINIIQPKYGSAFTGMRLLDSNVDPDKVDAIVSLDVGSFGDVDTNQNRFQYKKGGKDGVQWFPNCWMHQTGTDSLKATVECSNMMIAYKLANDSNYGKAELYVDGVLKETMNGYKNDGWNNATVSIVFKDDEIATHDFEIRMADGNENKKFTIYAIGYTNADDYKESLK